MQSTLKRIACCAAATALALLVCVVGALLCFPPLQQSDYANVGNFELAAQTQLIDLNTADQRLLCLLPGVGEKKAAAILEYRRQNGAFSSLKDVAKVSGISEKTIAGWQGLATVGREDSNGK